jgi:hypothetical protein
MYVQKPKVTTTSSSSTGSKDTTQVTLPDIPVSEQTHLPAIETGDSATSGKQPATASPQTGAVPNNGSANTNSNSGNSNGSQGSSGNGAQKKSLVSEARNLIPLLP